MSQLYTQKLSNMLENTKFGQFAAIIAHGNQILLVLGSLLLFDVNRNLHACILIHDKPYGDVKFFGG